MNKDQQILRSLALQVKEISSDPKNYEEKVAFWTRHTALQGEKPPVFVHPDGAWAELLPFDSMECEEWIAKCVEYDLRKQLFRHK